MSQHIFITRNRERAEARLEQTRRRIEARAHALFAAAGFAHGHDLDHWLQAERELTRHLPCELEQDERAWRFQVEVPGFRPADFEIDLGDGQIVVFGQNRELHRGATMVGERGGLGICRALPLPPGAVVDRMTARLERGVLAIRIPKSPAALHP